MVEPNERRGHSGVPPAKDPVLDVARATAEQVDRLTKLVEGRNGGVFLPRPVVALIGTITAAAILAMFSFVLDIRSRLDRIEAQPSPRPEVVQRLIDHERRLDRLEDGR